MHILASGLALANSIANQKRKLKPRVQKKRKMWEQIHNLGTAKRRVIKGESGEETIFVVRVAATKSRNIKSQV